MNHYKELKLTVNPADPWVDLIIADLGVAGFESFAAEGNEVSCYIAENKFDSKNVDMVLAEYVQYCDIKKEIAHIESINWNKEWEKNFDPIFVRDQLVVKSSFHSIKEQYPYEILVDPKMSFGTGHHATTYQMMDEMLNMDFEDKNVLDMGCGTGVLAILAKMKGAKSVLAIDFDEWAYKNSLENVQINNLHITVEQGDASKLQGNIFNIILANINLNVLLSDLPIYFNCLEKNGDMLLSGVLEKDEQQLNKKLNEFGLDIVNRTVMNNWIMLHTKKN